MKPLFPILCFFLFSLHLIGQQDIQTILSTGNKFDKMCTQADAYFEQKHPNLTPQDLVEGEHRDGEFVKYMRWKNYWETSLNPDGTLGDIATYRQAAQGSRNPEGIYEDVEWANISNTEFITLQISLGRTSCLAFHPTNPNVFYVGADTGGIWKTEDGGETYTPLGDDLPYLAVSSIVLDQENPNILYAALGTHLWNGLPSIGVYKSTDAGLSWNPTNLTFSISQNTRIYWLAADPNDASSLLAATQNGLYKTLDGFNTFSQITTSTCVQAHYKPGNSDIIYLGTNEGQFLKSTDGGDSFTLIEDFGNRWVRIALTPQAPDKVVVVHANTLKVSTDAGDSFPETYPLLENYNAQHATINPQNPNDYVVGYFELFRTTDGGENFTQICSWLGQNNLPLVHVDMRNTYVNPLQNDLLYFCHDGGIDTYNVETGVFTNLSNGLIITQFYDIAVSQSNPNVVSGGSQDNGSMFRNGNGTWAELAGTGDGMITEIDPNNENTIYWEYQFGAMRRFNGTNNASISPPNEDGQGAWITPYRLDPNNSNRVIVGYKNVYESLDQGNSWTSISGQLANGAKLNHIAIAEANGERIYAINGSSIYVKATDSDTWTTKSLPGGGVTDIEVNPLDEDKIIITVGGYTNGAKVYTSGDAGDTWINISGNLPNVRFGAVEYYRDIENAVFIGSDVGVFYRDDSSPEWFAYGQLPHTRLDDIEIQYSSQKIRVGTYGRGVFEADIDIEVCDENSPDEDGDGICDLYDSCPDLDDSLIGMPCDDGDPLSSNEAYSTNCICEGGASNLVYCTAIGSPGTGSDYIDNVQLSGLNNPSGQTDYSDFRLLSTDLYQDSTYTLTISLNYSFPPDTAYAWIDYDRSGSFDANELITMSAFDNNHSCTGTFTVPELMELGATTMRVRNIYAGAPTADPCGSYFGEVEDYTIQLKEGAPGLVDFDQDGFLSDVDCDDTNPDINPGQTEVPYNGINEDCNPLTLDDDLDQDGFLLADDCDDDNPNINPDQTEVPYNGIDEDCNPLTLDDDLDQDGFLLADDCDDDNPNINPDATEIPNNGIDEDCDGMDTTTSTYEMSNTTISIFPNPATDIIYIKILGELDVKINLFDITGKLVKTVTNSDQITLTALPTGTYLLEVIDLKSGQKVVEKMIIE
jgi:photosystem II stability/assembly factor-like uncharacterized protein